MKRTAVVVAPGRGTYNRKELGYFARHHSGQDELLTRFDSLREAAGQDLISKLDGADRFSPAHHTSGDNASSLIHACAYADFLAIDRNRFDILAVTGNSMGWYIALACAGALDEINGFRVANTMGTLMQEHMIGGQLIYPFLDDDWRPLPCKRAQIEATMAEIDARQNHSLGLSIDLGGMLVLAGNEAGLIAFEAEMPAVGDRFPMRLPNHAGFHTALQKPVAARGQATLGEELFRQPDLPMIDGRGGIWRPRSCDLTALRDYTLGHQVVEPYDFAAAIRVAAREFMPDIFIVLGPGTTLSGAVAQSLVRANWRGMATKLDFQSVQDRSPSLITMGREEQRPLALTP